MLAALRSRIITLPSLSPSIEPWKLGFNRGLSNSLNKGGEELLNLAEVEKILSDVKADDVKVIPVNQKSSFTDFVVIATGRSAWHVRNIAQALVYKVKQKQKGAKRMMLPSVEGQAGGKWIVVDSGTFSIALTLLNL